MSVILAPVFRQRFFDSNGDPLAGGKLYSYAAGGSTPAATYTDNTGSTPNANPIILDANGECDCWIGTGYFKFVLKNSLDVTQWTKDYVSLPVVENGFSTGDVKISIKTVADTGWVLMNDGTIGNAASSATSRANADTEALFTLLWNNTANADCAVSTGRGASAAADFAANKTIALPKALGRALATYGSGSGLTARAMAAIFGEESHALTSAENASHTHVLTMNNHGHTIYGGTVGALTGPTGGASRGFAALDTASGSATQTGGGVDYIGATVATGSNATSGSGTAHNNMQPTLFLNIMIKL